MLGHLARRAGRVVGVIVRPCPRGVRGDRSLAHVQRVILLDLAGGRVMLRIVVFFFQAEDGIRDWSVTGVQTCALPILFEGVWRKGERYPVWMSHGDRVTRLPPGFRVVGTSANAPIAMIADEQRRFYA